MQNWQRHMADTPNRAQNLTGNAISYRGIDELSVKHDSIGILNDPAQTYAGFPKQTEGGLA